MAIGLKLNFWAEGVALHRGGWCSPCERFNQTAGRCARVRAACSALPRLPAPFGSMTTKINGGVKAIFTQLLNIPYTEDLRACWEVILEASTGSTFSRALLPHSGHAAPMTSPKSFWFAFQLAQIVKRYRVVFGCMKNRLFFFVGVKSRQ